MITELIHTFFNLAAPPFTLFSLLFFLPPYLFLQSFFYVFNTIFSENVSGKVVLITGASSGIGEHLAYEYAKKGARLALVARREKRLRAVADIALYYGALDVILIIGDVQRVQDCRQIVDDTINHFGRLDHLINNAGIQGISMFEEATDINTFRPIMDTNFWGSANVTHFAVPYLRETRGKIVVLSSAASWLPEPRHSFYNASKAALHSFFETLRVELGSEVSVLIATPGYVESELTQGKFLTKEGRMDLDQDLRDAQISAIPVGTVAACARAIVNSACRGEKYMTQPFWFRFTWVWKAFFPDVVEWTYRLFYLRRADQPVYETPSKKILDVTGAQKFLYPESILRSEIKSE